MESISLEQLYNQYKAQIYSLCMKLTMSKDLSDDLFSETWMKVAEKLDQLNSGQSAFNWIYTICLNIYRQQKRKHSFLQFFSEPITLLDITLRTESSEELYMEKEESVRLEIALKKLKDKYRIPVILFYYKELSYQDISEIMHLPMSTVKYRLHEAKKILKTVLEKDGHE